MFFRVIAYHMDHGTGSLLQKYNLCMEYWMEKEYKEVYTAEHYQSDMQGIEEDHPDLG